MATDEDVLARSLGELLPRDGDGLPLRPELLYRPYQVDAGGARVNLLFRDHSLSDRIGFHYQSWEPQHAADDFLWRVRESGRRFAEKTGGEDATIVVILDGENAWEHYVGGGRPFLRELYGRLQAATDIQTVTMAEAASSHAKLWTKSSGTRSPDFRASASSF
jgi:alpha-amylase/alpha-mannosidase (GH57 family)